MPFKNHVPNIITLLNLSSGLVALVYAFNLNWYMAFVWVAVGIFLDFWDGFFARILNVKSELGLQLDSLADMVTSGVVPGMVMFQMLAGIVDLQEEYNLASNNFYLGLLPFAGFIITIGSCYRLAKFNIDVRQTDSFIGLPTPANALFILSLPLVAYGNNEESLPFVSSLLSNPYVLVGISLLSAYMLNAEIPLFSLKIKYFNWETNKLQLIFLTISIILLFLLGYLAIPIIIVFYVLLSVVNNKLWARIGA